MTDEKKRSRQGTKRSSRLNQWITRAILRFNFPNNFRLTDNSRFK